MKHICRMAYLWLVVLQLLVWPVCWSSPFPNNPGTLVPVNGVQPPQTIQASPFPNNPGTLVPVNGLQPPQTIQASFNFHSNSPVFSTSSVSSPPLSYTGISLTPPIQLIPQTQTLPVPVGIPWTGTQTSLPATSPVQQIDLNNYQSVLDTPSILDLPNSITSYVAKPVETTPTQILVEQILSEKWKSGRNQHLNDLTYFTNPAANGLYSYSTYFMNNENFGAYVGTRCGSINAPCVIWLEQEDGSFSSSRVDDASSWTFKGTMIYQGDRNPFSSMGCAEGDSIYIRILQQVGSILRPEIYAELANIQQRLSNFPWSKEELLAHLKSDIQNGRQLDTAIPPKNPFYPNIQVFGRRTAIPNFIEIDDKEILQILDDNYVFNVDDIKFYYSVYVMMDIDTGALYIGSKSGRSETPCRIWSAIDGSRIYKHGNSKAMFLQSFVWSTTSRNYQNVVFAADSHAAILTLLQETGHQIRPEIYNAALNYRQKVKPIVWPVNMLSGFIANIIDQGKSVLEVLPPANDFINGDETKLEQIIISRIFDETSEPLSEILPSTGYFEGVDIIYARNKPTTESIAGFIKAVLDGSAIYIAARQFGIPRGVASRHLQNVRNMPEEERQSLYGPADFSKLPAARVATTYVEQQKNVIHAILDGSSMSAAGKQFGMSASSATSLITRVRNMPEEERQSLYGPADFSKLPAASVETTNVEQQKFFIHAVLDGSSMNAAAKQFRISDSTAYILIARVRNMPEEERQSLYGPADFSKLPIARGSNAELELQKNVIHAVLDGSFINAAGNRFGMQCNTAEDLINRVRNMPEDERQRLYGPADFSKLPLARGSNAELELQKNVIHAVLDGSSISAAGKQFGIVRSTATGLITRVRNMPEEERQRLYGPADFSKLPAARVATISVEQQKNVIHAILDGSSMTAAAKQFGMSGSTAHILITRVRNMPEEERQSLYGPADFSKLPKAKKTESTSSTG